MQEAAACLSVEHAVEAMILLHSRPSTPSLRLRRHRLRASQSLCRLEPKKNRFRSTSGQNC